MPKVQSPSLESCQQWGRQPTASIVNSAIRDWWGSRNHLIALFGVKNNSTTCSKILCAPGWFEILWTTDGSGYSLQNTKGTDSLGAFRAFGENYAVFFCCICFIMSSCAFFISSGDTSLMCVAIDHLNPYGSCTTPYRSPQN